MRRIRIAMLAASTMLAVTAAAQAESLEIKLINKTGHDIDSIHARPTGTRRWGHDVLRRDTLFDGKTAELRFTAPGGACTYDIRVDYEDLDDDQIWRTINLCGRKSVTLSLDAGVPHAEAQ